MSRKHNENLYIKSHLKNNLERKWSFLYIRYIYLLIMKRLLIFDAHKLKKNSLNLIDFMCVLYIFTQDEIYSVKAYVENVFKRWVCIIPLWDEVRSNTFTNVSHLFLMYFWFLKGLSSIVLYKQIVSVNVKVILWIWISIIYAI